MDKGAIILCGVVKHKTDFGFSNKLYLTLDNHSPESLVVKSISGSWSEKTSASSGVEKFLKNVSLRLFE